ncbi:hypothetical protein [Tateyamaria omphalii]|uniref:hypothetical protein n=1 Tax=Tateyamaria omphalii TaxID=299262 RepID=UPI0012F92541|nr:hypothetical protein [Tateyamaria omphalii]
MCRIQCKGEAPEDGNPQHQKLKALMQKCLVHTPAMVRSPDTTVSHRRLAFGFKGFEAPVNDGLRRPIGAKRIGNGGCGKTMFGIFRFVSAIAGDPRFTRMTLGLSTAIFEKPLAISALEIVKTQRLTGSDI